MELRKDRTILLLAMMPRALLVVGDQDQPGIPTLGLHLEHGDHDRDQYQDQTVMVPPWLRLGDTQIYTDADHGGSGSGAASDTPQKATAVRPDGPPALMILPTDDMEMASSTGMPAL
jgi:hypothetical protein